MIAEERAAAGRPAAEAFDILVHGVTAGDDPARDAETTRALAEAGATWWTERINPSRGSIDDMRRRIAAGPPRF